VVKVGDEVDVYVLKLDRTNGRIGLSLRRLQPDPWTLVDTKYSVGQRVEGTITNVVDFGVFAQLEDGIEGLIHLSELSDTAINHPSDVVKRGNRYLLEIVKIEPQRQRIGLSLKRVPPDEQSAWCAQITGVESAPTPAATTEPTAQVEATSPVEAGQPQLTDLPTEAATGESSLEVIVEKPVA
jgi:small subunit ribosomal protein S1